MPDQPYVHVIMPVGSDTRSMARWNSIESAARHCGFAAVIGPYRDPIDLDETAALMRSAKVVVADLTLERPSCYYELAVAETVKAPLIVIAERGTRIHQTQNQEHVLFYEFSELEHTLIAAFAPFADFPSKPE